MKRLLLLVITCLPLLFSGCAKRIVDVTITIYGYVIDNETQAPLDGALVTITPNSLQGIYTGNDGYFEFANIEQQQYFLSASKKGYITNRRQTTPNPGERVQIIFSMEKE